MTKRYELCIENGTPQLVDVTNLGPSEGFSNPAELKAACFLVLNASPLNPRDIQILKTRIEQLIIRLKLNALGENDVLGSDFRDPLLH